MRKLGAYVLLSFAIVGSSCTANEVRRYVETVSEASDCQEDEPYWNCSTMGNRICGPRP